MGCTRKAARRCHRRYCRYGGGIVSADQIYKVPGADGYSLTETKSTHGTYYMGAVRTPLGYVTVYSEEKHTSLSLIQDGYEVTRVIDRGYTKRGLVTIARRFIEEVTA
jgi:hypothetical protein